MPAAKARSVSDASLGGQLSPDGRQIAFMSARDGNPEIYVMNADGSNLRRLTNHPAGESSPTWSPSGSQIAFIVEQIFLGQPDPP